MCVTSSHLSTSKPIQFNLMIKPTPITGINTLSILLFPSARSLLRCNNKRSIMHDFVCSVKMWHCKLWTLSLAIWFFVESIQAARVPDEVDRRIQTSVFLSPPFFQGPGSVVDTFFFDIPLPRGHIALKSFDAEVVDKMGIPVSLHETYLHHWVVIRYYGKKSQIDNFSNIIFADNAGPCKGKFWLRQYFGLGSETRRTSTWIPEPYGIEVGDPSTIPDGYEERWVLNVHAIDTRGVKDRLGCTECRCSLYNVTKDRYGDPLSKDYIGGLLCCYDQTQCLLREGYSGWKTRKLYFKYTVHWLPWDENVVPVKIYIVDVTDIGKKTKNPPPSSSCKLEYQVDPCDNEQAQDGKCVHTKKARVAIPHGGDVVYGAAHQHAFGLGSALYAQDGKLICNSVPTYGQWKEAGNEEGYVVGMSSCYPKPGSVQIADGEVLTIESNYSSNQIHTGVMALFYILVAEPQTQPKPVMLFCNLTSAWRGEFSKYWWSVLPVGVAGVVIVGYISRGRKYGEGYQSL